jgi:hypothetical protein
MATADHHSAYLAQAVAALDPEGHRRVDELLEQLTAAVGEREWLERFAKARRAEADEGRVDPAAEAEIDSMLTSQELDALYTGFATIRDTETRDDVSNWANAVLALLEDAALRR